jgi:hypothetical protein
MSKLVPFVSLIQTRRSRVLTTKEAMATDIIWLSEITDAYDAGERQGFVISRRADRLHFYSKQNDEIVKVILFLSQSLTYLKTCIAEYQGSKGICKVLTLEDGQSSELQPRGSNGLASSHCALECL